MAKGFDVLHIKSAVKSRNKFDLSRTHLTTMNFGEIVPLFCEETVPGDDITVNSSYFSRMAPLVKPTYGKFSFKTLAGYVPYHQIADDAEAWISGKAVWEGETTKQRYITMNEFILFIQNFCVASVVDGVAATSANTEFTYLSSNGTPVYRLFTHKGRYWMKVLNALGYAIPQGVDEQAGSKWMTTERSVKLSAYPLLAFFKLYNDYMSQSQRYNISLLTNLLKNIKHNVTMSSTYANGALTMNALKTMFDNLLLNYENDYFTSAWQNANMPVAYQQNIAQADVPALAGNAVQQDAYDNLLFNSDFVSNQTLGQRALDFLKSFDDWVRRNNYAGSRAVQNVYARFGIKSDDYRSNYAHIITTDATPIQVGDVTATADATNVPLGDYAGKGIMNGGDGVRYKADDYGILIILGWFTVVPMNAYGFDRKVLRNQPFDYYTPEYDGIGADAISAGEFYASPIVNPSGDTTSDLDVYGFTERYNAYRYGRDMITGDFRNFRNDGDMNVWHTGRLLTDIRQAGNLVAQSSSINTLPQVDSEYNRIFSITDGSEDVFYLTANFGVSAIRPMLNLNQVVKLGEGDTAVPRNGNVVN